MFYKEDKNGDLKCAIHEKAKKSQDRRRRDTELATTYQKGVKDYQLGLGKDDFDSICFQIDEGHQDEVKRGNIAADANCEDCCAKVTRSHKTDQ